MKTIEFDERCPSCKGTGIYVGMGERDGYAVVCHTCNGTGVHHYEHKYEEPVEKWMRKDVRMVVEVNPGICLGGDLNFGGMSYQDWFSGKPFTKGMENREYTCPAWWFQSADYSKKPNWDECGWGSFSQCQHFCNKDKCWERYDQENK